MVLESLFTTRGRDSDPPGDDYEALIPWKYNATRDYRTIIRVCPQRRELDGFDPNADAGVAHDPRSDNDYQIKRLYLHMPEESLEPAPEMK